MIRPDTLSRTVPGRGRQRGFSLVELMLALALGLIVVTGIVQLFIGNSRTYNVLNGQARMQENGRFALEFVARAARQAGYLGCTNVRENLVWSLTSGNLANAGLVPEFNISRPVEGVDNVAGPGSLAGYPTLTGNAMAEVDPAVTGGGIDPDAVVPGTDVLVVRSLETPGWRLSSPLFPSGAGSNPRIASTSDIGLHDVVMVANCEQAAVFRVTGVVPVGADVVELQHAPGGGGIFTNQSSQVSSLGRTYQRDALVGRVQSTFFFVAEGAGDTNMVDGGGNAQPPLALWQKVGVGAPVELVQGIDDLQILYGIDTTDDEVANANKYVTADELDFTPADRTNVVSVRVSVLASSVDAVTEDGNPLRRIFSKTVLLRNAEPGFAS